MDAIYAFVRHVRSVKFEDLPSEVVSTTKKTFLDTLGVAVAGLTQRGPKEIWEVIKGWEMKGGSTVIGLKERLPAPYAAQINATLVHALDYDDIHERAIVHPSVVTVPTVLAVAEGRRGLSGRDLICLMAAGADVICRMGLALTVNPIGTGFHLTSLLGYIVSALLAGRILGLTEEQMVDACGIAYHQVAGNGQSVKDGALTKRMGPGFAVRGGIMSALLAEKGITGAKNCLEGEWGLYNVYFQGRYGRDRLLDGLGSYFETVNVSVKPYPCCRATHGAIDCALSIVSENDIRPEEVEQIIVRVSPKTLAFAVGQPFVERGVPQINAAFSLQYAVACAVLRRSVKLEHFEEEAIRDERILSLVEKVILGSDGIPPEKHLACHMTMKVKDGRVFEKYVDVPKGDEFFNPLSREEKMEKFLENASFSRLMSREKAKELLGWLQDLESLTSLRRVVRLLSP